MEDIKYINYIYFQLHMLLMENGFEKEARIIRSLRESNDKEKIEAYSCLIVLREKLKWIKRIVVASVAIATICVSALLLILLMR